MMSLCYSLTPSGSSPFKRGSGFIVSPLFSSPPFEGGDAQRAEGVKRAPRE